MIDVRNLTPDDWRGLKAIRIKAVTEHTGYFFADPEKIRNEPDSVWKETLDGNGKQVFGLFDQDRLIGIAGAFTWREDLSGQTGIMAMDYILPEYRGKGLTEKLYTARIAFAKNHLPWKKLAISHREGNNPSRRAMIKHGFEYKGKREVSWPDGTKDWEWNYEINLEELRSSKS